MVSKNSEILKAFLLDPWPLTILVIRDHFENVSNTLVSSRDPHKETPPQKKFHKFVASVQSPFP